MVKRHYLYILVVLGSVLMPTLSGAVNSDLIKYSLNNNGIGSYSFEYEISDGTYRREDGGVVAGSSGDVLVIRGEYGYIDPDGRRYSMQYVADENGFQPILTNDDARFNDRRLV